MRNIIDGSENLGFMDSIDLVPVRGHIEVDALVCTPRQRHGQSFVPLGELNELTAKVRKILKNRLSPVSFEGQHDDTALSKSLGKLSIGKAHRHGWKVLTIFERL